MLPSAGTQSTPDNFSLVTAITTLCAGYTGAEHRLLLPADLRELQPVKQRCLPARPQAETAVAGDKSIV